VDRQCHQGQFATFRLEANAFERRGRCVGGGDGYRGRIGIEDQRRGKEDVLGEGTEGGNVLPQGLEVGGGAGFASEGSIAGAFRIVGAAAAAVGVVDLVHIFHVSALAATATQITGNFDDTENILDGITGAYPDYTCYTS